MQCIAKCSRNRRWDDECDRLKSDKYNALHKFRCSNSAFDLRGYKERRNSFKAYLRHKECDYQSNNRQELVNSLDNPSFFWKILKTCKSVSYVDDSISREEWYQYFHGLLFDVNSQAVSHDVGNDHEYADNNANIWNDPFELSENKQSILRLEVVKAVVMVVSHLNFINSLLTTHCIFCYIYYVIYKGRLPHSQEPCKYWWFF